MKKKEMIISLYLKGKTPKQIEEESGASSKYVKRVMKEYTPSWPEELSKTCDEVQKEKPVKLFRTETPSQVNLSGYKESFQGTIISGHYNVIGDINLENDRILLVKCPLNGGIYGVKVEDVC